MDYLSWHDIGTAEPVRTSYSARRLDKPYSGCRGLSSLGEELTWDETSGSLGE